jgi:hypothetical protein
LSDVPVFPITAPWSYRHFVPLLRDVLKSTMIEKELLLLIEDFKGLAHYFSGFLKEVSPAVEDVAWGNGAVICRPSNGVLNLLIPPTRFEMSTVTQDTEACFVGGLDVLVYLAVERGPVSNAAVQPAHVNKIETRFLKCPLVCTIIDLKLTIGRYPLRLGRRQVGANDLGGWEHIRHIPAGFPSQIILQTSTSES